jgi:tRNA U34 2-thiouridine synthase MnmA/TrmU
MNIELNKISKKVERCSALLKEVAQDLDKLKAQGTAKKRERKQKHIFRPEEHTALYSSLLAEWKKGNHHTVAKQLEQMSTDELRALARANRLPVNQKTTKEVMIKEFQNLLAQAAVIGSPVFIQSKERETNL